MLFNTPDNEQLYYEITGNTKAADTLVLLNGLTQSTRSWSLVTPYFEDNFRIVLIDFVFQGNSSKDGSTRDFDQHATDVAMLLASLKCERVHLAGLSYGSLVAQHFALLFPGSLNSLILLSTFAHKTPYYEAIENSWWRALQAGGYDLLLDIMLPTVLGKDYFSNPLFSLQKMKEARAAINTNSAAILKLMQATRERKDMRSELKKIQVPCLIIHGQNDLLLPLELGKAVHESIAGSKFVVLARTGHTLNLESVPEVCAEMLAFLKEVKKI